MKNINYKIMIGIGILIVLLITYISIPILIFPDSFTYLSNAEYLIGEISTYHTYRGPLYPLFLALISKVFGFTNQGMIIAGLLLYSLFGVTVILLFKYLCDIKEDIIIIVCLICFILLNPVIVAFSHFILTEFMAMVLLAILMLIYILVEKKAYKYGLIYKCIITFVFTILLYGTKQMFFPLVVIFIVSIELTNFKIKMIMKIMKNIGILMCAVVISLSSCSVGLNALHISITENSDTNEAKWATGYSGVESVENLVSVAFNDGLRYYIIEVKDDAGEFYNVNVMNDDFTEILSTYQREFSSSILSSIAYLTDALKASPKQFFKSYSDNYQVLIEYKKIMGDTYKHCPVTQSGDIRNWRGELAYFTEHYKYLGNAFTNSVNVSWEHTELETKFNQEIDQSFVSNLLFNTYYYDLIKVLHTTFGLLAPFIMVVSFISLFVSKYKKESEIIFILSFNFFFNTLALAFMGQPISRYAFPTMLFSMLFWTYIFVSAYKIVIDKISEKVKQRKII